MGQTNPTELDWGKYNGLGSLIPLVEIGMRVFMEYNPSSIVYGLKF